VPTFLLMPPFHRMATFGSPLCNQKTGQVAVGGLKGAELLPRSFKGGTQDVQDFQIVAVTL
jgi:hypothetical protein